MQRSLGLGRRLISFAVAIAFMQGAFGLYAQRQRPAAATSCPSFSFERLLELTKAAQSKNPPVSINALPKYVKQCGLAFKPTPENVEQLRAAGATEPLMEAVGDVSGVVTTPNAPPPVVEEVKKEGSLSVTCKPVECTVMIDGKESGTTDQGELKEIKLPEGKYTISAKSPEHIPDTEGQVIEIHDRSSISVIFTFEQDTAALARQGNALLTSMIIALGGENGMRDAAFFKGVGRIEVHDKSGKPTSWDIDALVRFPNDARFNTSRYGKQYQLWKEESGFMWRQKNLKGQEFHDLEDGLRYGLEAHLAQQVQLFRGPGVRVTADKFTVPPGEDPVFRVTDGSYTYRVTLNTESRPKEIVLESGGLRTGTKWVYADYEQKGAGFVPLTTAVLLPGSGLKGVEVKYRTVELNPANVKPSDFRSGGRR